jgi:Uma2 family endonuclease
MLMADVLTNNHANFNRTDYTVEEYEAIVGQAAEGKRYEYDNGKIIPFTDEYTTTDHNQIVLNTARVLMNHFYPKGCRVYTENVRLVIEGEANHRLPDVLVTCSERDIKAKDVVCDAALVVEVLSPSTSFTDQVRKAKVYKKISSLYVYLIIKPDMVWVRVYERDNQGNFGERAYELLDDLIELPSIGLHITARDLYRFVFD